MKRNVVLVGFMGSGKTTIGRKLAEQLDYRFVDTDRIIEERAGGPISQLFEERGEASFRELESDVVAELADETGLVIASGGGTVLDDDNVELLKRQGFLVYLRTDSSVIYGRVKDSRKRPLLNVPDPLLEIERLLQSRVKTYEKVADLTVDTGANTVGKVIESIRESLAKLKRSGDDVSD